jgi:hypothetical protein
MMDPVELADLRETAGKPVVFWAILVWDDEIREKRVTGIYLDAADANVDALAMEGGGASVTVEPWLVFSTSRFGSDGEPAWERSDADFDVPIQGDDL